MTLARFDFSRPVWSTKIFSRSTSPITIHYVLPVKTFVLREMILIEVFLDCIWKKKLIKIWLKLTILLIKRIKQVFIRVQVNKIRVI